MVRLIILLSAQPVINFGLIHPSVIHIIEEMENLVADLERNTNHVHARDFIAMELQIYLRSVHPIISIMLTASKLERSKKLSCSNVLVERVIMVICQ